MNDYKSDEQLQDEDQQRLRRLYEQQENDDYSRDEDGCKVKM